MLVKNRLPPHSCHVTLNSRDGKEGALNLKAHCRPEYFAEFHIVENCPLGNNSQSEHRIQQMNHLKTKGKHVKPLR